MKDSWEIIETHCFKPQIINGMHTLENVRNYDYDQIMM